MREKPPLPKYSNSQLKEFIMEYIHDKTDRKILYLRFIDNDTLEEIAGKVGLDKKTVWKRIMKQEEELFSHLPQ